MCTLRRALCSPVWAEDSSFAYSGSDGPLGHHHICYLPLCLKASNAFSCPLCRIKISLHDTTVHTARPSPPIIWPSQCWAGTNSTPQELWTLTLQLQASHVSSSPGQRGVLLNNHEKRDLTCPQVTCEPSLLRLQTLSGQHQMVPKKKEGHT